MRRSGFTLIELLVVVIIMLILTMMTVSAINSTIGGDRTRSAARQLQSYLEGARDRAIYQRQPVGVRFLISDEDLRTVESVVFVTESEHYTEGELSVRRNENGSGEANVVRALVRDPSGQMVANDLWSKLSRRGLLVTGARLKIGRSYYTVLELPTQAQRNRLMIAPAYRGPTFSTDTTAGARAATVETGDWHIELAPTVMPMTEPTLLARGVAIDLKESRLPSAWSSDPHLDIMFSPRGTVVGSTAAAGVIHFLLTDVSDLEHNRGLANGDADYRSIGDPRKEGEEILMTLFTHTGHLSTHRVNPDGFGTPDYDQFLFAETGETAK